VLLGNGDGTFRPQVTYASGPAYTSVQLADLNGDDVIDIAASSSNAHIVSALFGNGTGTFQNRTDFTTQPGNPISLAIGDFNGDGRPDFATADQIAPSDNISVLLNQLPTFPSEYYIVRATTRFIDDGDFSGDSLGDLAWARFGELILWNRDSNGFTEAQVPGEMGLSWHAAGLGDFNGDGHVDALWADASAGQLAVWELNGTNLIGFDVVPGGHMGVEWHVTAVADLGGDGRSDVVWQNQVGEVAIWTMDGTRLAGFGVSTGHMGPNWNVVAAGDFHGNDGQDLLWLSATGDVATWSMHGSTLTGYTALGHMGVEWHVAGSGDFNRDGTADIVWVDTSNHVQIWNMNGGHIGQFVNPDGHFGTEWHLEAVGNFTGGGDRDLLWITEASATAIWHLDGAHVSASQVSAPTGDFLLL